MERRENLAEVTAWVRGRVVRERERERRVLVNFMVVAVMFENRLEISLEF